MLAEKLPKKQARKILHLETIPKKITTLGTGYKVNTVMEVLILSQWKMLRTSLSSVKVQMVLQ
jgi:hypothetical protein